MKSLVVAPQPFFSPRGTPMSVYYRALIMAQQGVEIDLLTYGEGQDVDIPGVRIIRTPRFAWLGNVKTGPSVLKIFLDIFIALWFLGLLIRNRYDFVHAHEEAVFIALIYRLLFRFKLVYDMHSSLPEQLNNFGWSSSNFLKKLFGSWENTALRKSDAVITICPALADHALAILDDPNKHFLIENSIYEPVRLANPSVQDEGRDLVEETKARLARMGAGKVILYAGTLETYQGIDLLLEGMASAVRSADGLFLLVVGGSPEQVAHYKSMSEELGIDSSSLFTGRVSQAAAKLFAAGADVLTSPRSRGMNTPLKVYELLDSGKPFVATRIPSHTQVLTDEVAFLAEPDPTSLAKQLVLAATDEAEAAGRIAKARELYREVYSPAVYGDKISRLLSLIA